MSLSKQIPTLKDLDREILETKHKITLFNADLLCSIEKAEFGDECERKQEFDRVSVSKLVDKVSSLILEADRLKLNLQKFNDIYKENAKPGDRVSKPIQEVGAPKQRDSSEVVVKRGKQIPAHPSSNTDSGISFDERLSRPDSAASNQYLSPTAEACETDDFDTVSPDSRLSVCTKTLLTTQAETASSRRVAKSQDQRDTNTPTTKASTL